jgi:hypothetical protein
MAWINSYFLPISILLSSLSIVRVVAYFRANNPSNSPTWQPESLRQTIDNQNIVLIHVFDILRGADCCPVTVARVVISTIKLVHDEGRSVSTDILDLCQLWILDNSPCRIAWVGCQYYRSAASNLLSDLVGMDMIAV